MHKAKFHGGPIDGQVHNVSDLDELVAVDGVWQHTPQAVTGPVSSPVYALLPHTDQPIYVFRGYERNEGD